MDMIKQIQGNDIKGYSFADGVHWYWGDKEVAVINEHKREIEWCDRTFKYPPEVIEEIRNKMPKNPGVWVIEARRTQSSATGGNVHIFINNEDMGMNFVDEFKMIDGEWKSTTPDEELGKFVYACFWHKLDEVLHYSHRFRKLFKPNWDKECD